MLATFAPNMSEKEAMHAVIGTGHMGVHVSGQKQHDVHAAGAKE